MVPVLAVVAFALAGCGGDDDDDSGSAEPAASDQTTVGGGVSDSDGGSGGDTETDASDATDAADAAADAAGVTSDCDTLFPMAEVEDWFGEPAIMTAETNESLGQTICTWETVEDPEDVDDLAFQLIVVQVYSGDPIAGSNFADPSIYEDVQMIEGVGDLAYATNLFGTDYLFVDGDVAGSFSYSDVDMGDVDAPKRHTAEETEAMFRLFHDRVMG